MRISLTLAQLEAFAKVAQTENFRAAAQDLHVSQPALSRTIRLAEDGLGVKLFDRDTRHVALTPAGSELLPIARRILHNFTSAFSELGQFLDGRRGHVTVAALPSASVALVIPAMAAFREQFPEITFTLLEGQYQTVKAAVNDGRADVGVSMRPRSEEPFRYTHWLDEPMVFVCRTDDPLAARRTVRWSVFADRIFLPATTNSSIRPVTDSAFLHKGFTVRHGLEYPSVPAVGAMIRAGLGVTALPRMALGLLNPTDLKTIPLQGKLVTRPIGLFIKAGRSLAPAAQAFIRTMHTHLADLWDAPADRPRQ